MTAFSPSLLWSLLDLGPLSASSSDLPLGYSGLATMGAVADLTASIPSATTSTRTPGASILSHTTATVATTATDTTPAAPGMDLSLTGTDTLDLKPVPLAIDLTMPLVMDLAMASRTSRQPSPRRTMGPPGRRQATEGVGPVDSPDTSVRFATGNPSLEAPPAPTQSTDGSTRSHYITPEDTLSGTALTTTTPPSIILGGILKSDSDHLLLARFLSASGGGMTLTDEKPSLDGDSDGDGYSMTDSADAGLLMTSDCGRLPAAPRKLDAPSSEPISMGPPGESLTAPPTPSPLMATTSGIKAYAGWDLYELLQTAGGGAGGTASLPASLPGADAHASAGSAAGQAAWWPSVDKMDMVMEPPPVMMTASAAASAATTPASAAAAARSAAFAKMAAMLTPATSPEAPSQATAVPPRLLLPSGVAAADSMSAMEPETTSLLSQLHPTPREAAAAGSTLTPPVSPTLWSATASPSTLLDYVLGLAEPPAGGYAGHAGTGMESGSLFDLLKPPGAMSSPAATVSASPGMTTLSPDSTASSLSSRRASSPCSPLAGTHNDVHSDGFDAGSLTAPAPAAAAVRPARGSLPRPFHCGNCPAAFSRKHDLKRHISRIHFGLRPFQCITCPRLFARPDAMARHAAQCRGPNARRRGRATVSAAVTSA